MTIRSVTWGDDFSLRVTRAGGMPKVVTRLAEVWGKTADSRATLDKLRTFTGPEAMSDVERWRAYQVLVVIEQDPAEWGISRDALGVPPSLVDYFHQALTGPTTPVTARQRRHGAKVKDTPSYLARYASPRPDTSHKSPGALRATAA